jgi:hypothetical protein
MTSVSRMASTPALPVKALGVGRDLVVGTLLCLSPVTAILALGWITRRMATTIDRRWGEAASRPGWIMGVPRGRSAATMAGRLSANIEAGLRAAAGIVRADPAGDAGMARCMVGRLGKLFQQGL